MTTNMGVVATSARAAQPRVVVRGASADTLDRPAGAYLASLRWDGVARNPDTLSAGDFLARL